MSDSTSGQSELYSLEPDQLMDLAIDGGLHPIVSLVGSFLLFDAEGSLHENPEALEELRNALEALRDSEELEFAVSSVVSVASTLCREYEVPEVAEKIVDVVEPFAALVVLRHGEAALGSEGVVQRAYHVTGGDRLPKAAPSLEENPEVHGKLTVQHVFQPKTISGR